MYFYGGTNDQIVEVKNVKETAKWFKEQGALIREWYPEHGHTYPNDLEVSESNPKDSCEDGSGMINCGVDLTNKYVRYFIVSSTPQLKMAVA